MKKIHNLINRVLVYGLFLTGVILLFRGTGRVSTTIMAFGSFIGSVLIAWLLKTKNIDDKYMLAINATLWGNLLGEIAFYYHNLIFYDKILHILLGIILSAIIYSYYATNSNLKRDAVFYTTMGLLAIWEIYEFSLDSFFGFQSQGVLSNKVFILSPLEDTMYDLIWGAIGSLFYLFFKKEKVDLTVKKDVNKAKEFITKDISKAKQFIQEKRANRKPHYFRRVLKELFSF